MTRASGRKTGPTPSGTIARLKANCIARYKLANVPGRPEELRQPGTTHAVSIQYGAMQIRVRLMDGRTWVKSVDFQVERFPLWLPELRDILDPWFGFMPGVDGEPVGTRTTAFGGSSGGPLTIIRTTYGDESPMSAIAEHLGAAVRKMGGRA